MDKFDDLSFSSMEKTTATVTTTTTKITSSPLSSDKTLSQISFTTSSQLPLLQILSPPSSLPLSSPPQQMQLLQQSTISSPSSLDVTDAEIKPADASSLLTVADIKPHSQNNSNSTSTTVVESELPKLNGDHNDIILNEDNYNSNDDDKDKNDIKSDNKIDGNCDNNENDDDDDGVHQQQEHQQHQSFLDCEESCESTTSSSSSQNLIIDHQDDSQHTEDNDDNNSNKLENKNDTETNLENMEEKVNETITEEDKEADSRQNSNNENSKEIQEINLNVNNTTNKRKLSIDTDTEDNNTDFDERRFLSHQKILRLENEFEIDQNAQNVNALDGNLLEAAAFKSQQQQQTTMNTQSEKITNTIDLIEENMINEQQNDYPFTKENFSRSDHENNIDQCDNVTKIIIEEENNKNVSNYSEQSPKTTPTKETVATVTIDQDEITKSVITTETTKSITPIITTMVTTTPSVEITTSTTATTLEPFEKCAQLLGVNVKFKCFLCLTTYDTYHELREHHRACLFRKSSHNKNLRLINNANNNRNSAINNLLQHTSSNINLNNNNSNSENTNTNNNNNNNQINKNKQTKQKIYLCSECGTYLENWTLFLHMREVHQRYICLYCHYTFRNAERLTLHLEMKHDVEQIHFDTQEKLLNPLLGITSTTTETIATTTTASTKESPITGISSSSSTVLDKISTCYVMCCICEHVFTEYENFSEHKCLELIKPCQVCNEKNGKHNLNCKLLQKQQEHKQQKQQKKMEKLKIKLKNHENSNNKNLNILNTTTTRAAETIATTIATTTNSNNKTVSSFISSLSSSSLSSSNYYKRMETEVSTEKQITAAATTQIRDEVDMNNVENFYPLSSFPIDTNSTIPITTPTNLICDNFKENQQQKQEKQQLDQQQQNLQSLYHNMNNSRQIKLNGCFIATDPNTLSSTTPAAVTSTTVFPPTPPPSSSIFTPSLQLPASSSSLSQYHQMYSSDINSTNFQSTLITNQQQHQQQLHSNYNSIDNTNISDNISENANQNLSVNYEMEKQNSIELQQNNENSVNDTKVSDNIERKENAEEGRLLVPKFKLKIPKKYQIPANVTNVESDNTSSSSESDDDDNDNENQESNQEEEEAGEEENKQKQEQEQEQEQEYKSADDDNQISAAKIINSEIKANILVEETSSQIDEMQQEISTPTTCNAVDDSTIKETIEKIDDIQENNDKNQIQEEKMDIEEENSNKSQTKFVDNEEFKEAMITTTTGFITTNSSSLIKEEDDENMKSSSLQLLQSPSSLTTTQLKQNQQLEDDDDDDGIKIADEENTPVIDLLLSKPLDKIKLIEFLRICLRATYPFCLYCNYARRIAVNCKSFILHLIGEHRFSATVDSITAEELKPQTIIMKLKNFLTQLNEINSNATTTTDDNEFYFNLETYSNYKGSKENEEEKENLPNLLQKYYYEKIFECFQCRFETPIHKELYLHNRKMHLKTAILCFMCKSNFFNYSEILCHMCPGESNKCVIFDIKFRCCLCDLDKIPSAFRLMVHLRKAHYACDVCLEDCQSQSKLSSHVWKHKLHHLCYRCGIAYRNKSDITKHLFWKHGTESELCKRCLQKRWRHVYHFCIPPTIFVCEICNLTFSRAMYLKVHKRSHSGDAPYPCTEDNCEQKFISRKLLLKHVAFKHNHQQQQEIEEEQQQQQKQEEKDEKRILESDKNKINESSTIQKDYNESEVGKCHKVENDDKKMKEDGNHKKDDKIEDNSSNIKDNNEQTASTHSSSGDGKREKKKKKSRKDSSNNNRTTNLDDIINLPAPNLSESDSSDDDTTQNKSPSSLSQEIAKSTTIQSPSLSVTGATVEDALIDVKKVDLSSPSDTEDEDGNDNNKKSINHAPVMDIWKNFKAFQASQKANKTMKEEEEENDDGNLTSYLTPILHISQSDHDYCLMYKSILDKKEKEEKKKEKNENKAKDKENHDEKIKNEDSFSDPTKNTASGNSILKKKQDKNDISDEHDSHHHKRERSDSEKANATDHSSSVSTPSPKKKQKQQQRTRTQTESSSDDSSSSSSSSCSCGSNCSCSSSSGSSSDSSNSSSDIDSDVDSSTSEGRKRIAAKRAAKEEKQQEQRKRSKSENSTTPTKTNNSSEIIVDVVTTEDGEEGIGIGENASVLLDRLNLAESLIQETDLETDESDTDEDFYDEHPQKLATQLLAEKRKQLMLQTCLSPSHHFDIVENSRPSTPSLPEEVMKEKKVKFKKKKRERKTSSKQQQQPIAGGISMIGTPATQPFNISTSLHVPYQETTIPATPMSTDAMLPPATPPVIPVNQTPLPPHSHGTFHSPPFTSVPHTISNSSSLTPAPFQQSSRLSTGSNSDAEAPLKRSKRARRPNKFYGYSSDDDTTHSHNSSYGINLAAFKPIPPPNYTWRKEDLPAPSSKSSKSGRSSSTHSRKSSQSTSLSAATLTTGTSPAAVQNTSPAMPPIPPIIIRPGALHSPKPPVIEHNVPLVEPLKIPLPSVPVHHIQPPQIYPLNSRESQDSDSSDEDRLHIPITQAPSNRNSSGGRKSSSKSTTKSSKKTHKTSAGLSSSKTNLSSHFLATQLTPPQVMPPPTLLSSPLLNTTETSLPTSVSTSFTPSSSASTSIIPAPPKHERKIPPALLSTPPDAARLEYFRRNNIRYPIRPPVGARPPREGESIYCYCRCPYDEISEMIACDGEDCLIEWFHFECVGILFAPSGKWFCPECRQLYSNAISTTDQQQTSTVLSFQNVQSSSGSSNNWNSLKITTPMTPSNSNFNTF